MRFPRIWSALVIPLIGLSAAFPAVARGTAIEVGYYALYEITVGDFENGKPVVLNEFAADKRGDGTYDMVRVDKDSSGAPFAQRLIVDRSGKIVTKDRLLICEGTRESWVHPYSTTVFTYSLQATDAGLNITVVAEEEGSGSAATQHRPSEFLINHYRKVSTRK